MTFYERFRTEVARYAPGVHRLGAPAPAAAVAGFPDELASFLRSFDGADLFIEAVTIFEAGRIERDGELLVFGETQDGDALALDPGGAVVRLEADTGEAVEEGTGFARWIEGYVAAEGVIYDEEGEFRDGIFGDDGEELSPRATIRRERKALRIDPFAPGPTLRLARALERSGKRGEAEELLAQLVERAPGFAWAWFDLGRLRRALARPAEAEEAFARAAEAQPGYGPSGYFAAHAARVAGERGDADARARHAARALALDPGVGRAQKAAAQALLAEERREEAREAAAVAAAVLPRDVEAMDLVRRTSGS